MKKSRDWYYTVNLLYFKKIKYLKKKKNVWGKGGKGNELGG